MIFRNSVLFRDVPIGPGVSQIITRKRIPTWNTAGRPKKAKKGTIGFNFKTKKLEYWNGSRWLFIPMIPIKIPKDTSGEIPQGKG